MRSKTELRTVGELILMGKTQKVSNDEVEFLTGYILSAVSADTSLAKDFVKNRIRRYTKSNNVEYMDSYRLYGMPCICYCISSEDEEDEVPYPFTEDYGTGLPCAFCYVLNTVGDDMSEFGDVFFKKQGDGFYHIAH